MIRLGLSADALTFMALAMSLLGGVAIAYSPRLPLILLAVPPLALSRIGLNALDGMVAVATGTARPFGEFLNEMSDRLSDAAWFTGLAFVIDPRLALGTLAGALLCSFLGVVSKAAGGSRIFRGVMGKADRMIVLSIAAPVASFSGVQWLMYATWLIAAGLIVTIVQRLLIARNEIGPPPDEVGR